MLLMSPYDAHTSSVGPVFDAATWSPRKTLMIGLFALLVGLVFAGCGVLFFNPHLLDVQRPAALKDLTKGLAPQILDVHRRYAWSKWAGTAGLGLVGYLFFGVGVSCLGASLKGDFYFRIGPGGLSLRVPETIDPTRLGLRFRVLSLELPWRDVATWTIVQVKELGSMSRNAGNLSGYLQLETVDGRKHRISLDVFREPAFIIRSKAQDALEMVPAFFGEPPTGEEQPVGSDAT
jgi:hypothetical protein